MIQIPIKKIRALGKFTGERVEDTTDKSLKIAKAMKSGKLSHPSTYTGERVEDTNAEVTFSWIFPYEIGDIQIKTPYYECSKKED